MDRLIEQTFEVPYRYPVLFTRGAFSPDSTVLASSIERGARNDTRVLVVLDSGVAHHHPHLVPDVKRYFAAQPALQLVRSPIVIPGGEVCKHEPQHVTRLHELIDEHGIDRHSYVIAVGGGALIDMVGYAAATAHRGVRLVRMPTTVLSQNDSAVGVKNSVNAHGKKNFLGTFAPPHAVVNDLDFLTTLEDRDWRGGLSEAVKVALLKDTEFFTFLETSARALRARDMTAMEHAIFRCAELHIRHIGTSGDPFERGSARPLDFGHWAAHKLESLTNYRIRHGEAVSIGIALDCVYARRAGMLPAGEADRVIGLLRELGLPLYAPELAAHLDDAADPRSILSGLNEFREHLGGRLTITLLQGIGRGVEVHEMNHDTLRASIHELRALDTSTPAQEVPA